MHTRLPKNIIVHCWQSNLAAALAASQKEEIINLTAAINLKPLALVDVPIKKITPHTYIASGKVKEILTSIQAHKAELVIVNATLSPRQQQALEKEWNVKVLDRTALILEIFGERARSKEAKLQTELAQLAYQKGRLVRSWTHLERQRGGAGFMGGPGERQIESDRRQIATKIKYISSKLESVRKRRAQNRNARAKVNLPVIALVGYTNAGKSTLFNLLTKSDSPARNMLFDTLDTKMRKIVLPNGTKAVLSDTVGFISNLPHDLVAAFRATLEEVSEADIILHVRDFSHPDSLFQKQDVEEILQTLHKDQPIIEVLNKTDLTNALLLHKKQMPVCAISAKTGEGIDELLKRLAAEIDKLQARQYFLVHLTPSQVEAQRFLYKKGQVLSQTDTQQGWDYEVILSAANLGVLKKKFSDVQITPRGNLTIGGMGSAAG